MADTFADLFPFTWKGVAAPIRMFGTKGAMDSADHKRVDRDGARVETLGLNPYEFDVQILFLNGLTPGPGETWGADLFPVQYLKFIQAFEDRSTGPMQHPVFGALKCKCLGFTDKLDAETRSGIIVDAVFKKTNLDDASTDAALGKASVFSTASVAAGDLDAASADSSLSSPIPPPDSNDPTQSFSDFVGSVKGIGNTADFLGQQFGQRITSVISTANDIADTFSIAPNTQVRVVDSAFRLASSLRAAQAQQLAKAKATSIYTVPKKTTLGALAGRLKNTISDLMALNPSALSSPIIAAGAAITYYS